VSVGVDIGGTKCLGVRLDGQGRVVAERRVATPSTTDGLVEVVAGLATELGAGGRLGVGVPGLISRDGVMRGAPNLLSGEGEVGVRSLLEARLGGTSVVVDNDATCAVWGEHRLGAARGADDVVLVTLGTGIGGGFVTGGRLVRGARGFAGEVGNMVVDPDGSLCTCGARGCWEAHASGLALGALARELAGDAAQVRGEHLVAACREGDEPSLAVLATFASWLAIGIANLVEILDPEVVIVGGGLSSAADVLFRPVEAALAGLGALARHPGLRLVPAQLGYRAGAVGAALLGSPRAT
jgi:glucokinase